MCYNCGCGNPHDDMGHDDNITEHTFEHLAQDLHLSLNDTKLHVFHLLTKQKESKFKVITDEEPQITEVFTNAAKAWGQSTEEARTATYTMLEQDIKKIMKNK